MANYLEEIKETLTYPDKVTDSLDDEMVRYYYKHYKHLSSRKKYLLIVVKYLNGGGFVITAYLKKDIR